ncbi:MAG: 2OG-Fe(II) oxygenase family protein, partial [Gammaproteobacteria bacterium]|nr:2OG-Fe(II) oxygenase family protein [Gammaproteobacteria bacterium]
RLKPERAARINERIAAKLKQLTADLPDLPPGGKWQTDQNLHRLEEFSELTAVINGAARGVVEFMKLVYTSLEITGCWANISAPGARHKAHTHPNNFLSGVYYVKAPKSADTITFDDPRPQTNIICPQNREASEENAGQMFISVAEGTLILFPAWLPHSVQENKSGEIRISVSFNLMFTQFGERMSQPKWEGNVPVEPS